MATDRSGLRIISDINTKVRRLGYFTPICRLLETGPLPEPVLIRQLEAWANSHGGALANYISPTGIIQPSLQSTSAKRYLRAARSIDLIVPLTGGWRLAKDGRVLLTLDKDWSDRDNNPFELVPPVRLFFLFQLLGRDADYLIPIMELLSGRAEPAEGLARPDGLYARFRNEVERRLRLVGGLRPELRPAVAARLESIRAWERPERYLEHLLLPRLHWCLDLHLLDREAFLGEGIYRLSEVGRRFLGAIPVEGEGDGSESVQVADRNWLEDSLFTAYLVAFEGLVSREWRELSGEEQQELLRTLVARWLPYYRTSDLVRMTASQFLLTACIELACRNHMSVGFSDLKSGLQELSLQDRTYIFRWSVMDDDGYIMRARTAADSRPR